jgi:hypothetical protein
VPQLIEKTETAADRLITLTHELRELFEISKRETDVPQDQDDAK